MERETAAKGKNVIRGEVDCPGSERQWLVWERRNIECVVETGVVQRGSLEYLRNIGSRGTGGDSGKWMEGMFSLIPTEHDVIRPGISRWNAGPSGDSQLSIRLRVSAVEVPALHIAIRWTPPDGFSYFFAYLRYPQKAGAFHFIDPAGKPAGIGVCADKVGIFR